MRSLRLCGESVRKMRLTTEPQRTQGLRRAENSDTTNPRVLVQVENTPKAFANFSPTVGGQRQPWDQRIRRTPETL